MKLSIITVTYNSVTTIEDCILSVVAHTLCDYEHLVVDNASTDGTAQFLEKCYSRYVTLIKNQENQGFAAGNNQAFEVAKGEWILFLNPDNRIIQGYLDYLIDYLEQNPSAGLIGCKLLTAQGKPHEVLRPKRFPKLFPYYASLLRNKPFFCIAHPANSYAVFDDDLVQPVDVVRGAFMLCSKRLLKEVGFAFDPRYFLLMEDVDLCRELYKRGREVIYHPGVCCIDEFEASFRQSPSEVKASIAFQSVLQYIAKWHGKFYVLLLRLTRVFQKSL